MENGSITNFVSSFKVTTKAFVLHAIKFCKGLPIVKEKAFEQQLRPIYSSRVADRVRNKQEFYANMKFAEDRLDENLFWHNVLTDAGLVKSNDSSAEVNDIKEILAAIANAKNINNKPQP